MEIIAIPTKNLVEELSKREGVEMIVAEPRQDKIVSINGPAIIMMITD